MAFLIPVATFSTIAGQVVNIFNEIPSFGTDESLKPDPATFIVANYTLLAQMAEFYDSRFENWHIPINYTVTADFTNTNYDVLTTYGYGFSDNGALWTGTSLVGFIGKYLAGVKEGNETLKNDALRVIQRLVDGMAMMLAVPNGGLGPEFGAIVARKWAAPEHKGLFDPNDYDSLFNPNHGKYFNGTWPYSQYRWSDYTSNDEYGGYYMGIAIAFKYLDEADAPDVYAKLKLIIDQLCAGMLRSNFLGIGGFGGPTGVDQKMRMFNGATWALLVLKMGALAYPEKYASVYYNLALENMNAYYGSKEGGIQEIVSNYYAFNFGIDMCFGLLMLEEDPTLLARYIKNFEDSIWYCVRYHRNPYFNAIYLAAKRAVYGSDASESFERDVEDQLMEFYPYHYPDVNAGWKLDSVPSSYHLVDFSKYHDFFENNFIGVLFAPLFEEFDLTGQFYDHPLTVKLKKTSILMWDRNPFEMSQASHGGDGLEEMPGTSFTAPYWIMRGIIGMPNTGVRVNWTG
ncbi:MAG: hypothetical protein JW839_17935 [Candidatus Lokiarchaeota archaeon]|nr:hypothetical protein [Candidatus Lokiarchaeota archaeon]